MIVLMPDSATLTVQREKGDKPYRPGSAKSFSPGWHGAESNMLYAIQKYLKAKGIQCLKKRMWKDGHMWGSDETQYIRSPGKKGQGWWLYDPAYALRIAAQDFNNYAEVKLTLCFDVFAPDGEHRPTEIEQQAAAFRALLEAP